MSFQTSQRHTCSVALDISVARYAALVQEIVYRLNEQLTERTALGGVHRTIAILDIFGFECGAHNTFEQFCINLSAEKLQHCYLHEVPSFAEPAKKAPLRSVILHDT